VVFDGLSIPLPRRGAPRPSPLKGGLTVWYVFTMPSRRLIRFARENRGDMTPSEFILWEELRGRRLGVRFRRQDPIGPFIADFSCRQARLVIEVDGVSHDDSDRDRRRDRWFHENGWFVLRLHDDYVVTQPDDAVAVIQQALADPSSVQDPLGLDP